MVVIRKKYISVGFGGQKLRERNKSLSILININNSMSTCLRPGEVLETAVSSVMEHFGFNAGRMYVMDKGGRSLTLAASRGVNTD